MYKKKREGRGAGEKKKRMKWKNKKQEGTLENAKTHKNKQLGESLILRRKEGNRVIPNPTHPTNSRIRRRPALLSHPSHPARSFLSASRPRMRASRISSTRTSTHRAATSWSRAQPWRSNGDEATGSSERSRKTPPDKAQDAATAGRPQSEPSARQRREAPPSGRARTTPARRRATRARTTWKKSARRLRLGAARNSHIGPRREPPRRMQRVGGGEG